MTKSDSIEKVEMNEKKLIFFDNVSDCGGPDMSDTLMTCKGLEVFFDLQTPLPPF
jgi:hypothetical protein